MPDFEVCDLVKVPFPYTNRPVQQRRPALVVAVSELAAAGLPPASVVRPARIATIKARNAERIGHLPPEDRFQVAQAVSASLAQLLAN